MYEYYIVSLFQFTERAPIKSIDLFDIRVSKPCRTKVNVKPKRSIGCTEKPRERMSVGIK